MIVRVHLTPGEIGDAAFRGKAVVVIDVLRANTSIAYARANGAEKLIPTASIEAATRLATSLDRATTLLCGEREGRPISGFDLGNSPLEFTNETVAGKTLIMTTTNGTETIARLDGAREIVVCSLVNVSAVARYLREESELSIACSGKLGAFSLEDAVCAGSLIVRLRDLGVGPVAGNDAAVAAGLARSAGLITSAAAIMVCLFASFGLTELTATREFGLGLAVAVALDASIIRLVVIPALMRLLGEANWWFPRLP